MPETSLVKKLRMQPGQRVLILNAPAGYVESLGELPEGVELPDTREGKFDFVHLFVMDSTELDAFRPAAMDAVKHDGLLWISYPKRSAKVQTDLSRDVVWELMQKTGLRPVTQVSVDAVWSAMRFRPEEKVAKSGMEAYRRFLKSDRWTEWRDLETDQKKKVRPLPAQKPCPEDAKRVDLVPPEEFTLGQMPLLEAVRRRKSRRKYLPDPLTLEELSFLLWATQGVKEVRTDSQANLRTVLSGGARHPFETYLLVNRVNGLEAGLYRYLPMEHKLCLLKAGADLAEAVHKACFEQYVTSSAATFVWTTIPYRTEWRYSIVAHKIIALDAGHVCQNLYLAAEAIGAGACAIGAYDQEKLDRTLDVDGKDEFAIYVATVGKVV